jgi:hypothetical protein
MKRFVLSVLFACFPILLIAADIPEIVDKDQQTSQELCVARAANDCINTICPNSPDINCSDNCQDDAQDKCQEMTEE